MSTLKQKAISLIENRMIKTGMVLQVRDWEQSFTEVDLYLPGAQMHLWREAQHMKCKVAPFTYRDYTPAEWDAGTSTCTLFIETSHDGPGSRWARALKRGDQVMYVGIGSAHHRPEEGADMVCLGDESGMGHFLALRQLAKDKQLFTGAVALHTEEQHHMLASLKTELNGIERRRTECSRELMAWVDGRQSGWHHTVFYLAGYSHTVAALRKALKAKGISPRQIRTQGFWS
jgi:NADPH-dependent ferric siderophore reductase